MSLNRYINFIPSAKQRGLVVFVAWFILLLIGIAHHTTGPNIGLYPFYLVPILIVTWFVGVRWGALTVLLSIISSVGVDVHLGLRWTTDSVVFFNEMTRFGMYMLLVLVVWQWRCALDREMALARLDVLTRLPNRRAFLEQARLEWERARRYGHAMTAIMMDLDNFKTVNDEMGHARGDDLLRTIADVLRKVTRSSDVIGRLGGDEFAIMLPETRSAAAVAFADKLRRELLSAMQQNNWPVTVSLGVVTYLELPTDVEQMLKRADGLMYAVKHEGKNQIKYEEIAVAAA